MIEIDALGKACPLPVIETRKALKEHDGVTITVDNKIATENLRKMAEQMGCDYTMTEESPTHYTVTVTKKGGVFGTEEAPVATATVDDSYLVVISSPTMGVGDDTLGKTLLKTFIYSLTEQDVLPSAVIFYNGGVPLVTEGSESLEDLQKLADYGVPIYACGTCLNYYGLTDKVAIGEVTNLYRILEMMRTASRIVRP